jgi:hypothetical protein
VSEYVEVDEAPARGVPRPAVIAVSPLDLRVGDVLEDGAVVAGPPRERFLPRRGLIVTVPVDPPVGVRWDRWFAAGSWHGVNPVVVVQRADDTSKRAAFYRALTASKDAQPHKEET